MLMGLALMDIVFPAMGATEDQMILIKDYMMIYFIGIFLISMPIVGNGAMRAGGDTFTPAIIMTVAAFSNAMIDPILIFGLWGFPRLEMQGAAISTVIANTLAMLASLHFMHKKKMISTDYLFNLKDFKDSCKRLLSIAIPAGITTSLPAVVNSIILALLSASGPAAVAAFGVVNRLEAFFFVVMMGISSGMAPIIGQNFGAGKIERVREVLKIALWMCVIWSVFVAVLLVFCATFFADIFSSDADVQKFIILYFLIVPISYAFGNLVSGWGSAFNALGMPKISAGMIFLKLIILLIPAVYLGQSIAGATGIFVAIALVNIITGIAFHLWGWRRCGFMLEKSV
jgi:putative MATE family efflux protein